MTELLVIRLRALDDAPASWLIVDANGARSGPVSNGPIGDALSVAQGRRVVLLLPATDASLAEPELPLRGGARVAQAVPFALEEQLATDVESLHFAVGTRPDGASGTPVAVVARALLERWLASCAAAGIHVDAAYVESQALPIAPNGCTLLLDDDLLYVRRSAGVPYVLDAVPLPEALELALGPATETTEHVTFYATPTEYERHRGVIEELRNRTATLQVKLLPDGALPLLAAHLSGAGAVNVLQGAYAPSSTLGTHLKRWRLPLALAAGTLLVFLLSQAVGLWQMKRAERQLDAQTAQLFTQLLPGQKMLDARSQVEGMLNHGGSGAGALLPAVTLLAQAVAKAPAARVESLSYRGNALELRIVAPTVEVLDSIKQSMSRAGAAVELESATPRGEVVEGRLQVKLGAA
jgi:general secretion pathway protein L